MTRERILELLDLVVLEIANNLPVPSATSGARNFSENPHGDPMIAGAEWAFVKGIAAGAVDELARKLRGAAFQS